MKERQRHLLDHPVTLLPGDRLVCKVKEPGEEEITFVEEIGRPMEIDTVVTFDLDGEVFGLISGIGAIFGKAK